MSTTTATAVPGIPWIGGDAWGGAEQIETETLAHIIIEEAVTRIAQPNLYRFENAVINTWGTLCAAHLPPEQAALARRYHALAENFVVLHTWTILALAERLTSALRAGIDPTVTLEENLQIVLARAGLGTVEEADTFAQDFFRDDLSAEWRALFPDMPLGIGTSQFGKVRPEEDEG